MHVAHYLSKLAEYMTSTIVFTVFLSCVSLALMLVYSDPWVPLTMGYCIIGIYADKMYMKQHAITLTSTYKLFQVASWPNSFQLSFSPLYYWVLVLYIWYCCSFSTDTKLCTREWSVLLVNKMIWTCNWTTRKTKKKENKSLDHLSTIWRLKKSR